MLLLPSGSGPYCLGGGVLTAFKAVRTPPRCGTEFRLRLKILSGDSFVWELYRSELHSLCTYISALVVVCGRLPIVCCRLPTVCGRLPGVCGRLRPFAIICQPFVAT
eukprot:gene18243-biopygen2396